MKKRFMPDTGQYNPTELEARIRKFWENSGVVERLTQLSTKKKKFYLLDGPPYVNAEAHVGHIKTTVLKDVWSKFKLIQGFSCWWQPGFDCHGLPIENMVEKDLGIKSKRDIEKIGVENFTQACRQKAEGNEKIWLEVYKKLGVWRGYVEPYLTLKNYYIESAWWAIKQMHEKGMLYQGEKPTFWCPHCQSSLSGYEVTDAYAEVKDPYIYVKYPLAGRSNEYIVIATTTPWTLVSNVAIAVKGDEYYVKARVDDELLILSEKCVGVLKDFGLDYKVEEKFLGKELEGMKYEPVLDVPVQRELKKEKKAHTIVLSVPVLKSKSYKHGLLEKAKEMKGEFFDFVNAEEGSGAVHTAPGHGPEDYYIGQHYQLPTVSPVDDEGKFTDEAGEFSGIFVRDANEIIVEELRKKGYILHASWVVHSYPLCWRCKSPLVYRLTKQWFLSVDEIKEKMLEENERVRWLPEFGREKFRNWLKDATDWCISRQRYWGIPLPIWVCGKCGSVEVVGSVDELRKKSRELPEELDLHKHVVDKIELTCPNCSGIMKRIPDIFDVWFDSGIAPFASLGYPYKNKELFELLWPVDMIDESQDQIRGWFYSLMFCSVAIFGISPYEAVAMNGWVLDEKGEKMSKSLGNVVTAEEAVEKMGADVLRLYYCWEIAPWEIQKFSFKTAEEVRRALNILWNCYSFFNTYVVEGFEPQLKGLKTEDRWLLSRINSLIKEVTEHLEKFEFHYAGRKLTDFVCNDLSRFYIKLVRDRVWITESGSSKLTALSVLHKTLVTLSKLFAPITPFLSEEIYQGLTRFKQSVLESGWPKYDESMIDKKLEEDVELMKEIVEACLSARQQTNLRRRWPVKTVVIVSSDERVVEAVKNCKDMLLTMCNSKDVVASSVEPEGEFVKVERDFGSVFIEKQLTEEILEEALVREVIREVQEMRKKSNLSVKESISLTLNSDEKTDKILEKFAEVLKKEVGASKLTVGKIEGRHKGVLKFRDATVDIAFDRI
jgi:isoleucyl-tRNA synthetase